MPLHVPHATTDSIDLFAQRANDNDRAVASLQHGASAPPTPLPGEMWSDTGSGMTRQRTSAGTWVDLWGTDQNEREPAHAAGYWGSGDRVQLGWMPELVVLELTSIGDSAGPFQDSRCLCFMRPDPPGGRQRVVAKKRLTFDQAAVAAATTGFISVEFLEGSGAFAAGFRPAVSGSGVIATGRWEAFG